MNKILVVDDDNNLLDSLKYNLLNEGYSVSTAGDGTEALELARREKPDLIILDIMLPFLDGFELCRILRKETDVPILILTAKTDEVDRVVGLEIGADDYMSKPFSVRELMARVKAMLRRSQWSESRWPAEEQATRDETDGVLKKGQLEVDLVRHQVMFNGNSVKMSPKEFDLLAFLMQHRGQVFSRERLIEHVWEYDYTGTARTVDVHIRSLRQKMEDDPDKPKSLLTVHGFGYKFQG